MRGAVMAAIIGATVSGVVSHGYRPLPEQKVNPASEHDYERIQKAQEKRDRRAEKALKGMK